MSTLSQIKNVTPKKEWVLSFVRLEDVEEQEIQWLWYPYIPRGTSTLLVGNGGMGKSWITCSLAADLSAGRKLPGAKVALPPQKILIASAEDDIGHIIKPRMKTLNADMKNIFVSDEPFILDEKGVRGLESAMSMVSATIVFLDPLVAYLGGKMDINKSNESRAMIGPLTQAAARTNCAVVIVHHVRKDGKGKRIHQAMGSADITNSVRSALLVDENQDGQHYMIHAKHNWSSKGPALAYSVKDDSFRWGGAYQDTHEENHVSTKPRGHAKDFLLTVLAEGPMGAAALFELASARGINASTLNRAKPGIAKSMKLEGQWIWQLEDTNGADENNLPENSNSEVHVSKDQGEAADPSTGEVSVKGLGQSNGSIGEHGKRMTPELMNLLSTMKANLAAKHA